MYFSSTDVRNRVGVDRRGPQPPLPSPLPPLTPTPPPRLPLPSPSCPTSLPLEYISRPHRKKRKQKQQVISSYNLSFQCMDYYQSFKTVWHFVCLFLRSFVSLFSSFTTIVVRPSRVCGEMEEDEGRQDK